MMASILSGFFSGLGAALLGLGYVYQRFVFPSRREPQTTENR